MRHFDTLSGPNDQFLASRTDQARDWNRLGRFLILGSEDGTYYVAPRPMAITAVRSVLACLAADGLRAVREIVTISNSGRAPKNDPALYALALAASPAYADSQTNAAALAALPAVARGSAHLAAFAAFAATTRGWGRGLRGAVANWYTQKPVDELARQVLRHRASDGWSHKDLLRLAHPKTSDPARNAVFRYLASGEASGAVPQIEGFERARAATDTGEVVRAIEDYRLTHDMVPDDWKESAAVWEALLESMSYTALLRNLGRLTAIGLFAERGAFALAASRLRDRRRIEQSGVQPVSVLSALAAYRLGHGGRGKLRWTPAAGIADALNEAFHLAFANVRPIGRRLYLAIDAGGSMQSTRCNGMPHLDTATAAAAVAMMYLRSEADASIAAFHDRIWPVEIGKDDTLDRAVATIPREPRSTDASLPFRDALHRKLEVGTFVILTDNESWTGDMRPAQALNEYRRKTGMPARLAVIAMAASECGDADSNDAWQLNVAGFDATVPLVVRELASL